MRAANLISGLLAFCLFFWPQTASAQWAKIKGWTIDTHDGGCMLYGAFEGNTSLMLLLDGRGRSMDMSIMLSNPAWNSIVPGRDYDVTMDFDQGTNWTVEFRGNAMDNGDKILIRSDNAYAPDSGAFAEDFMSSFSLYIGFRDREVARLSLFGTRDAFNSMVDCHKSFVGSFGGDPFATDDPFR